MKKHYTYCIVVSNTLINSNNSSVITDLCLLAKTLKKKKSHSNLTVSINIQILQKLVVLKLYLNC